MTSKSMHAHLDKITEQRTYYPSFENVYIGTKFNMKSEVISRKKSYVDTQLGTNHRQLIMPSIRMHCSNIFLERSVVYAAPCGWNKLIEQLRTSNFDCLRKSIKTILFTQQYGC